MLRHTFTLPYKATFPCYTSRLPLLALNNSFGKGYCAGTTTSSSKSLWETTSTIDYPSFWIAGFNGTLIPEPDAHLCSFTSKSKTKNKQCYVCHTE